MNQAKLYMIVVLTAFLVIGGMSGMVAAQAAEERQIIRIAYTGWASSVASGSLAKAVFQEKLGIRCRLIRMDTEQMWRAVAEGSVDAMLSAWLPDTHSHYWKEFGNRVADLGPNLEGTRTGLVVPAVKPGRLAAGTGIRKSYITVDSIEELPAHAKKFNSRIIGIEPEAGIMRQAENAIEAYGLEEFELVRGSEAEMADALARAIRTERWIVITGWVPHWSFARWNLRFLEDPKTVFGGEGRIHTIARTGLEDDMPEAFGFLDRFYWKPEDVGQLMMWIEEDDGRFPYDKALRWMHGNPDRIDAWTAVRGNF